MRRPIAMLAAILFALPAAAAPPVQVMIVGGFHMSNPGRDLHNVAVDDVLAPARQAQIAATIDGLMRFSPTAVAAEWDAATAAERYPTYLAGKLPPSRNEVVQLGFALAARMNLATVHGIDVEGDFPFEAVQTYAAAHGQDALVQGADGAVTGFVRDLQDRIDHGTIGGALRWLNDPATIVHGNEFYRALMMVGGGTQQPGAELLAAWYHRNALICANLLQMARPGDRIVVFYGSGHSFLLRQCVSETKGFELVEPNAYLPK